MSASCLYEGSVRHRRFAVRPREFCHAIALAYIDLDELPELLGGRLLDARPGPLRFRRADYLGDPSLPLGDAVRRTARELTGVDASGPVRVLTHLRTFGHCFNPVSFYFCMDEGGEHAEAVLAEVTNTPWGERQTYGFADRRTPGASPVIAGEVPKAMHVSPFMAMDYRYRVRVGIPGPTLSVHIENERAGEVEFDATLALRRRELSRRSVAGMLADYPWGTLRVLGLIYGHAVALGLRRVPVHPHPARART